MSPKALQQGRPKTEKIKISFDATQEEWNILDDYCKRKGVTKSSVLRTAIQKLAKTMKRK